VKKPVNNFTKKKEGNTNAVAHHQSLMPVQYVPYMATSPQQQPHGYFYQMPSPQGSPPPQQQVKKVFDPIPVPYRDFLPYVIHNKMVTPRTLKPMTAPFPAWYKQGSTYEYHSRAELTIDNCKAFKYKVQELIDQKLLTFKEVGPNVKCNPLPGHYGANVYHASSAEGLIREVSDIQTPLAIVREAFLSYDRFSDMHAKCEVCEKDPVIASR
jgi:hypothetical protein